MKITHPTEAPAALTDVRQVARDIGLQPAEKKAVSAARATLEKIAESGKEFSTRTCPTGHEYLRQRMWDMGKQFTASPSPESAEKFAISIALFQNMNAIANEMANAFYNAQDEISRGLQPVVEALLDRVEKNMGEHFATAREALAAVPALADELRHFDARADRTRADLAACREEAKRDALGFIVSDLGIEP
jgi:aspartate aminotransferase-like enzyme